MPSPAILDATSRKLQYFPIWFRWLPTASAWSTMAEPSGCRAKSFHPISSASWAWPPTSAKDSPQPCRPAKGRPKRFFPTAFGYAASAATHASSAGSFTSIPTRSRSWVGIVADTHYDDLHTDPAPAAWFAIQQDVRYMPTLHVRTSDNDAATITAAVRGEFDAMDKGFPVFNIKTFELRIEDAMARERMVAALSAAFGILALSLAGIGLYGLLAFLVTHRTREIGIRMALGSSTRAVLWLTAREALALITAGSVAGIYAGDRCGPDPHAVPDNGSGSRHSDGGCIVRCDGAGGPPGGQRAGPPRVPDRSVGGTSSRLDSVEAARISDAPADWPITRRRTP